MRNSEAVGIKIDTGKRLVIKLETVNEPGESGKHAIYYTVNG